MGERGDLMGEGATYRLLRGNRKGQRVARVGRVGIEADRERIRASLHLHDTSRCAPVRGCSNRIDDLSSYRKQRNHSECEQQKLERLSHLPSLTFPGSQSTRLRCDQTECPGTSLPNPGAPRPGSHLSLIAMAALREGRERWTRPAAPRQASR